MIYPHSADGYREYSNNIMLRYNIFFLPIYFIFCVETDVMHCLYTPVKYIRIILLHALFHI